ncbi:MAG: hypothetical protein ACJ8GN_21425 [Longimicrobiaceae bacterium]
MTETELISYVVREAKVAPTTAARVIDALRAADLLDPIPGDGPAPSGNGRRNAKASRLTEAEIRAKLIEGFEKVRGMEIEDVYPGGWSDTVHP